MTSRQQDISSETDYPSILDHLHHYNHSEKLLLHISSKLTKTVKQELQSVCIFTLIFHTDSEKNIQIRKNIRTHICFDPQNSKDFT